MEQLKRRRQKLVAALMAATTLSGGKTAPPAAAMSQGLNKATTKAATNKKSGLPTWAKWLIAGGASAAGIAAIAGTIWYCLKDKNKNSQDLDKKNDEVPVELEQESKKVNIKSKINIKKKKQKEQKELDTINEDIKGENESQSQSEEKDKEEIQIINNTIEDKENEEKQKEEEDEAKREAEKQENVSAFCEKVKEFEPLSKAMDSVINWGNYNKKDAINRNNGFSATYRPLQDNIKNYGKTVRIKNVGKCQNQQLKNLIKNKVGNDIDKDFHYVITLNGNSWNVVLFGDDKVAIYELNDIFYFYKYQAKN
jgi:hypothetical protein